ncbi:glutathionyl-hydroquinone reductase YqjG [Zea mays]|uniref:glutathionyl-hydroquinone reductase YqjG n=1 Tax=Zea mays TaxID=4577 RepID=UPI000C6C67E9|nr:glutathionyl-hydroquinone reductase YqjG [Zea mays]|eukprot:XP_023156577.1 uncharacterized protein LOC103636678 [Zea mays]
MIARSALDEVTYTGDFDRSPSTFRSSVSRDGRFPTVAGRYHLYVSYACPWASRCLAFLKLKGLDHAIGVTVMKPIFERTKESDEHLGWVFPAVADEEPGAEPNPLNGAWSVRELYEIASSNYAGKPTIPVLWDKQLKTVVNNESSEIIRMLNAEFNGIARNPGLDEFLFLFLLELSAFGFVKFRYLEDATVAKREMNHQVIGGREISIVYARRIKKRHKKCA